jgi:hypothetical protein
MDRMASTTSCTGVSGVDSSWPGRVRGAPKTSSAEETALSSLGAALKPSSSNGRCSGHCRPASLDCKASFS